MNKISYFFEKESFGQEGIEGIPRVFYSYRTYFREVEVEGGGKIENDGKNKFFPVRLYFGRNHFSFIFIKLDGQIQPLFTLETKEGELNQIKLSSMIEAYWKMPVVPIDDNREKEIYLDKILLSLSYFSSFYDFKIEDEKFKHSDLFNNKKDREINKKNDKLIEFPYLKKSGDSGEYQREKEEKSKDVLRIDNNYNILTKKINFRLLILDFLFEMINGNTFEDENYYSLELSINNNKVFNALSKKAEYLHELKKIHSADAQKKDLPSKDFKDAEKEWLNICCLENYTEVFRSPNSIFFPAEKEIKHIVFNARIPPRRLKRYKILHLSKVRGSPNIRNRVCSFFLRQYDLWSTFRLLYPYHYVLGLIILSSLLVAVYYPFFLGLWKLEPLIMALLISIIIISLLAFFKERLNLFKMFLPRMFLGILIGWSTFWGSRDAWLIGFISKPRIILLINLVLITIIFIYLFTEIRGKLSNNIGNREVIKRTLFIIMLAMYISFIQGFFIIQLFAEPVMEHLNVVGDILKMKNDINRYKELTGQEKKLKNDPNATAKLEKIRKEKKTLNPRGIKSLQEDNDNIDDIDIKPNYDGMFFRNIDDYFQVELKLPIINNFKIHWIWPLLLSQFILSIFIGIVLQLIWEDRPITEPL